MVNNRTVIYLALTFICLLDASNALAIENNQTTESICKSARKVNAEGVSFWDGRLQQRFYKDMLELGHSERMVSGYFAYLKVDMGERCPQVW